MSLLFIQNIWPFLTGSTPLVNSYNQLTLTKFERCERYTIDLKVYLLQTRLIEGIFAWKRGCLCKSELKKLRLHLSEDDIAEFLTKTK